MAKTEGAKDATPKKKTFKKRGEKRVVHHGFAHIQASFNNTLITITDTEGNVVSWSSAGAIGFKGSRKGTPYAATQAAMTAGNVAKTFGMRSCEVLVKGPGSGRESAVRALQNAGMLRGVTPSDTALWIVIVQSLVLGLVVQGFPEELLWRGYLMQTLPWRSRTLIALYSAGLFGLMHLVSSGGQENVWERILYICLLYTSDAADE